MARDSRAFVCSFRLPSPPPLRV
ncbi:hypothetical protein CGRA01v4_06806 [Colletotrichum graminicola]|nr:hypothetical protein CGRA01v4_06806 [Colletotrichum graminicola]